MTQSSKLFAKKRKNLSNLKDNQFLVYDRDALPASDSAQSQPERKSSSYETPVGFMKQTLQYDWSVPSFNHPLMNHLNPESELNSLPFIPKPMPAQQNTFDAHLCDPGHLSGDFFDHPDASQSQDEPTISRRRKATNVIESSGEENDDMYASNLTLGIFPIQH
jgi:hypothetical protein